MKKTIAIAVATLCAGAASLVAAQGVDVSGSKLDRINGVPMSEALAARLSAKSNAVQGGCGGGTPITTLPFQQVDTTVGGTNSIDTFPDTSCVGWTSSQGPEDIYLVTLASGNNVTFQTQGVGSFDQNMYLLSTCGDNTSCVAGADVNFNDVNMFESFSVNGIAAGSYFLYIDSYYPAGGPTGEGGYTLDVTGTLPVELLEFQID